MVQHQKLKKTSWILGPVPLESSPQLLTYIAFSDYQQPPQAIQQAQYTS